MASFWAFYKTKDTVYYVNLLCPVPSKVLLQLPVLHLWFDSDTAFSMLRLFKKLR